MIKKIQALIYLIIASVILCICSGCSGGGGDTGPYVASVEDQEMTGVWLGGIQSTSGEDSVYRNVFSSSIITRDGQAVFMNEDGTQFVADGITTELYPGGGWIAGFGQLFEGSLLVNRWDTTGDDYSCDTGYLDSDELSGQDNYFYGSVATKTLFWGQFRDEDYFGEGSPYAGAFAYDYNTTYEVSPKVTNLEGTWVASNVFKKGRTLSFTIDPGSILYHGSFVDDTTSGTITGYDTDGVIRNEFTGDITIHYTEEDEIEGNIYDVTLIFDGIEMRGFASYVQEVNTEGVYIGNNALLLGVSNQDLGYMVNVLSTMAD